MIVISFRSRNRVKVAWSGCQLHIPTDRPLLGFRIRASHSTRPDVHFATCPRTRRQLPERDIRIGGRAGDVCHRARGTGRGDTLATDPAVPARWPGPMRYARDTVDPPGC